MPAEDPSFEYRNPAELARQVIGQLGQAWNSLSPENQTETGKLLAQVRTELVQAAGDGPGATALLVFRCSGS